MNNLQIINLNQNQKYKKYFLKEIFNIFTILEFFLN
jgi:hypothetical protein